MHHAGMSWPIGSARRREEVIELAAIMGKLGARIEELAEHLLHLPDVLADGDATAQLLLQVGRRRE
jgi:hypothetical protein